MRDAVYELSIEVVFAGPSPLVFNRAAPEISATHELCVEQIRDTLKKSGFKVGSIGSGHKRIEPEELL